LFLSLARDPVENLVHRHLVILTLVLLTATAAHAAQVPAEQALLAALKQQHWDVAQTILAGRVNINAPEPDGSTALHWAVHFDRTDLAGRLIRAGANVNAATDLGVTALSLACENASPGMVTLLLQAGANPNGVAGTLPPIMVASRSGNPDIVAALLARGADANAVESMHQQTALMWAVANSHPQVVSVLLRAGARVNARSSTQSNVVQRGNRYAGVASREEGLATRGVAEVVLGGSTPLLFAARVGDLDSARLLIEARADVNDASPDGASALVTAAHSGHGAVAAFLIEKGADVNADEAGYTALHAAVLRGDKALVSTLLDRGANPEAVVQRGTASRRYSRDYAFNQAWVGATPFWLAARFAEVDIMRNLLAHGAKAAVTTGDGTNPVIAVITAGVESGPSASDRRERRLDPLDITALAENRGAFEKEVLNTVRVAVDAAVDVNATNNAGDTAMHQAAARGFATVIQFLFDHGARLDMKNKRGLTPLALTSNRRNTDENPWLAKANELLRSLGAKE
jgi:ankyrin repeat protein